MTVQGPVKEQQPDGMSHRGGGVWVPATLHFFPPPCCGVVWRCWMAFERALLQLNGSVPSNQSSCVVHATGILAFSPVMKKQCVCHVCQSAVHRTAHQNKSTQKSRGCDFVYIPLPLAHCTTGKGKEGAKCLERLCPIDGYSFVIQNPVTHCVTVPTSDVVESALRTSPRSETFCVKHCQRREPRGRSSTTVALSPTETVFFAEFGTSAVNSSFPESQTIAYSRKHRPAHLLCLYGSPPKTRKRVTTTSKEARTHLHLCSAHLNGVSSPRSLSPLSPRRQAAGRSLWMPVMHGVFYLLKDFERLGHPQRFLDVVPYAGR